MSCLADLSLSFIPAQNSKSGREFSPPARTCPTALVAAVTQTRPPVPLLRSMSITFVSAFTGDVAGALFFPTNATCITLHMVLGKGVDFFRFILGGQEISAHRILEGHVTVHFIKQAVRFNIFFHDELTGRMWLVDEVMADLLSHWKLETPNKLAQQTPKARDMDLEVATFWKKWLQPELHLRAKENPFYTKLGTLIATDIMRVRKITRRNILHEKIDAFTVNLYFSLDLDSILRLKLKPPVPEANAFHREELQLLILRTPLD